MDGLTRHYWLGRWAEIALANRERCIEPAVQGKKYKLIWGEQGRPVLSLRCERHSALTNLNFLRLVRRHDAELEPVHILRVRLESSGREPYKR